MALVTGTGDPNAQDFSVDDEGAGTKAIEGRSLKQIAWTRIKRDRGTQFAIALSAFFVLVAILAPILNALGVTDPYSYHQDLLKSGGGMSWDHPLGVVPLSGTDVLSRLMYGVTFSMIVGLSATVVAISIGLVVGLIAGFAGGKTDFLASRFIDLVLCFPQTLMLLALSGTFVDRLTSLGVPSGNPAWATYIILVLGLFGWPTFARIIRGQVLALRNREFVEASKSLGAKRSRIYFTELLPNLWAPVLVYSTLTFPVFISAEAALSYLGVGIRPPTPTLGNIITDSVTYAQSNYLYFFAPSITLALIVLGFNLLGDGLRDALDPKADRH